MGGFKVDHLFKKKKDENSIPNGAEYQEAPTEVLEEGTGSETEMSDTEYTRGVWTNKLEFILSVIGYSVGVGNLWRFPYLVMQNGGGAFLIPFFFFMLLCGVPLFYLELCLGQFSGTSCLYVWKFCPLFKGVGYMMMVVSFVYCWYYIMVIVWVLVYFANSFLPNLPWGQCGQSWNTEYCISGLHSLGNVTGCEGDYNCTAPAKSIARTASKEFWNNYVLSKSAGLEEMGGLRWHLCVALVVAWVVVFLCLFKGIKSVGKVVYVTALLPYLLLTVFLVRGLTLPGAINGILFYIKPDFTKLSSPQVWLQAAVQVFYSLGPAWGGLITMASYNKFNNNCLKDALICCIADGFTSFYGGFVIFSVIGYIAYGANMEIPEVATSGPGLALVIYPEAITKLPIPQLWAAMFFFMLLCLGIDSQFGVFETLSSSLTDMFPWLQRRKLLLTASLCVGFLLIDLPYCTNDGIFLYQLVDWYFAAFCVLIISFLECFLIGWIYGADRFCKDIALMIGHGPSLLIRVCWCFVTPTILFVTFLVMCYQYEPPSYDGYTYSLSAKIAGNILAIIPIIPLPISMIYEISKAEGTFIQRVRYLLKPAADWGPRESSFKAEYSKVEMTNQGGVLNTVRQNLLGSVKTTI